MPCSIFAATRRLQTCPRSGIVRSLHVRVAVVAGVGGHPIMRARRSRSRSLVVPWNQQRSSVIQVGVMRQRGAVFLRLILLGIVVVSFAAFVLEAPSGWGRAVLQCSLARRRWRTLTPRSPPRSLRSSPRRETPTAPRILNDSCSPSTRCSRAGRQRSQRARHAAES